MIRVKTILLFLLMTNISQLGRADLVDDIEDDKNDYSKPIPIKKEVPRLEPKKKDAEAEAKRKPVFGRKEREDCQIYFKGNNLSAYRSKGIIELFGDVVVNKCELEIRSDSAIIKMFPGTNQVESVKAEGKVRIANYEKIFERNIKANGYEAIFTSEDNKIILLGTPAKLDRGGDLFHGDRINYDLDSGWVKASDVKGVVRKANDGSR